MRVLLTGFPPFPGRPENPSQRLVETFAGARATLPEIDIKSAILPVEYDGVEAAFDELVDQYRPQLILSFGVGRHTNTLRLESVGVNCDDATIPDNANVSRNGSPIIRNGPPELVSSLRLESLCEALSKQKIPNEISRNAGRYVCNHLLYYGSYQQVQAESPYHFLFTHLPTYENGFELETAASGVEVMLNWFLNTESKPATTFIA